MGADGVMGLGLPLTDFSTLNQMKTKGMIDKMGFSILNGESKL